MLRDQIDPDPVQYGGVKGSGVEQLLAEIWERILGGLEVGDTAVSLMGLDYEKAFNRMSHDECLAQLSRLGASADLTAVVFSFLIDNPYPMCLIHIRPFDLIKLLL